MHSLQNRSNCAFRFGFLRLATNSTAQFGLNEDHSLLVIADMKERPFPAVAHRSLQFVMS